MSIFQQLTPEQQMALKQIQQRQQQLNTQQQSNKYIPNSGKTGVLSQIYKAWVTGKKLNEQEEKASELLKKTKDEKKQRMSQLAQILGWETPKPIKAQPGGMPPGQQAQAQPQQAMPASVPRGTLNQQPVAAQQAPVSQADRLMQVAVQNQDEKLFYSALQMKANEQKSTNPLSGVGKLYFDMESRRKAGTLTPQMEADYRKAIKKTGKSTGITINNIPKLKPGQVMKKDPSGNMYIETIQGAAPKTREEAATTQGVQQGVKTVRELFEGGVITNPATKKQYKIPGIFDKDGNVDRKLVTSMYTNFPGSDGRIHRGRIKDALQAKLRAETGAAAPDSEVKNLMERYMPSIYDSDAAIVDKLNRLKNFTSGFLAFTDPQLYRELRSRTLRKTGMSKDKIESTITNEIKQGGMPGIATDSTLNKSAQQPVQQPAQQPAQQTESKPNSVNVQAEGDRYFETLDSSIPETQRRKMTHDYLRSKFNL